MKEAEGKIVTPLARARGLGSAHEGSSHWLHERITSVALIPLMLWLAWAVARMPNWDHAAFTAWLAAPLNAILMILAILVAFYHAALGSRVIAEDYISSEGFKTLKLLGINFFFSAAAVAAVFCVLKIAFG